jgi:predicted permease
VRVDRIWGEILQRTAALPGVEGAGAVTHVPLAGVGAATSYYAADRPPPEAADKPVADVRIVRGDYFRTMGIPLLAGRGFDERDGPDDEVGAVIVNESLAQRLWPGGSALGKRLQVYWGDEREREIVGVVQDVHHTALETPGRDALYFPHRQEIESGMTLVLRSGLDAAALLPAVRRVVAEVDPTMPLFDVSTLSRVVREASSERRFLAGGVAVFALLALFLAGFGIFSVSAFAVAERGREIGLRLALGATRGAVARMVLRQAAVLTALALAAGLGLSLLAGRFVESLLFEVRPDDPLTLAAVTAVLAACALLAAWGPARRAAKVAPMQALRLE